MHSLLHFNKKNVTLEPLENSTKNFDTMNNIKDYELSACKDTMNKWMKRFGVKFGVHYKGAFKEQQEPYDPIPHIISKKEWEHIEKGLKQRSYVLNKFLWDVYHDKHIVKDKIIPEELIYSSKGYMPECEGIDPVHGVYTHIAGIDLAQDSKGDWYILEDKLRLPSGVSYPMIARTVTEKVCPEIYKRNKVVDNRNYLDLLKNMMDEMCNGRGEAVVLTPGRDNPTFYEHSFLAYKTGATLAFPGDLIIEDNCVYYSGLYNEKKRVGCIYRRVNDEYIDPNMFKASSVLGVPNIMESYSKGDVSLINAVGNGVADDKSIYYFIPKMIRYYLNEDPIIPNVNSYLPYYSEDINYILDNISKLVIKDNTMVGGYGVIYGCNLSTAKVEELQRLIRKEPSRWIAEDMVDFKKLDIWEDGTIARRRSDMRAFVINGKEPVVWKGALTRFTRDADSRTVNTPYGCGFKDTWIMED